MSPKPGCSLSVLFAPDADTSVIFRRGPSRQVCMIAWDMAKDTFETGQWFKGRVYAEHSCLSPDGKWLVAAMASFKPPFSAWHALSQPPYFTAHTVWPTHCTYFDSPSFVARNVLRMSGGDAVAPGFSVPPWLKVIDHRAPMPAHVESSPSYRQRKKPVPHERWKCFESDELGIWGKHGFIPVTGADWLEVDRDGDVVFSIGGRLHRIASAKAEKARTSENLARHSRLLADFTDLTFRPLQAPAECRPKDRPAPPHHTWRKARAK